MLFKKSQDQKKISQKVEEITGTSYSILEIFKEKLDGSPKYQLLDISKNNFDIDIENYTDLVYATIELRKKGLVIYFRYKNEEYQLACHFNQVSYLSNDGKFDLQTDSHQLKLKVKDLKRHHIFIRNWIKCKSKLSTI
jgi:hypothetical protein